MATMQSIGVIQTLSSQSVFIQISSIVSFYVRMLLSMLLLAISFPRSHANTELLADSQVRLAQAEAKLASQVAASRGPDPPNRINFAVLPKITQAINSFSEDMVESTELQCPDRYRDLSGNRKRQTTTPEEVFSEERKSYMVARLLNQRECAATAMAQSRSERTRSDLASASASTAEQTASRPNAAVLWSGPDAWSRPKTTVETQLPEIGMRSNVPTDRVAQHQQRLLPRQPIPLRIPCACEEDNANDVQTREVRTTVQSVLQAGSTTVNGEVQRTKEQSNVSDARQKAESYRAVQSADGAEQLVETASSPDPNVQATRTISARTLYIGYLSAEVDTSDINYGDTNRLDQNKNHLQGKTVITTDNNASSRPNASLPVVDVPVAREGLTAEDLRVPTRAEIEEAVRADFELQEDKQWLDTGVVPTGDADGSTKRGQSGKRFNSRAAEPNQSTDLAADYRSRYFQCIRDGQPRFQSAGVGALRRTVPPPAPTLPASTYIKRGTLQSGFLSCERQQWHVETGPLESCGPDANAFDSRFGNAANSMCPAW